MREAWFSAPMAVRPVTSWDEAETLARQPADQAWLALNEEVHGAGAPDSRAFLRKYALYCAGRWPLGVYGERFAIY
jgi:hypothetical protein